MYELEEYPAVISIYIIHLLRYKVIIPIYEVDILVISIGQGIV